MKKPLPTKSDEPLTTVYLTACALSQGGIRRTEGYIKGESVKVSGSVHWLPMYFYGNDWHLTLADAVARVEKMRSAKIKSLLKQMARLESGDFTQVLSK